MPKKRTRHAESRALKKEALEKRQFLESDIHVFIHPFGNRSLERLLDALLKSAPENLSGDISDNRSLVDHRPLDFEEILVLDSVLVGVSDLRFIVSSNDSTIFRSFFWKEFFDELVIRAVDIGLDFIEMRAEMCGVDTSVRRQGYFDFPEIPLSIEDIVRNAVAYWQLKIKTSGQPNPKGKSEFVAFLAILIRAMIYRPKHIPAERTGGMITYEYTLNGQELQRFKEKFPKARYESPEKGYYFWNFRPPTNWSIAPLRLVSLLSERQYIERVVLLSETRPAQNYSRTLRNFCATKGVEFITRWTKTEVIDLDLNPSSIYMIEDSIKNKIINHAYLKGSIIFSLTGIEKSHQQRRHQ